MKVTIIGILMVVLQHSYAEVPASPRKNSFRRPATHDELVESSRKQIDPMKGLQVTDANDPSIKNQPVDLLEQSDIICFRGLATLIPKRAIISAPPQYQTLLKLEPGARIVGWQEFYVANRAWITTIEVTRLQAEGNEPIPADVQERIAKSKNLIVATYKGGAISVLPQKESKVKDAN